MNRGDVSKKDTKLILLKPVDAVSDGQGGRTKPTEDEIIVWAEEWKPSVSTVAETGTIASQVMHRFKIWRRTDVKNGWRVMKGSKIFVIEHAYDYEKTDTMLVCREVSR